MAKKVFAFIFFLMVAMSSHAGLVVTNPSEYIILTKGENDIASQLTNQSKTGVETAVLQGSLVYMNNKIMTWQSKYNSYLKSANFGTALAQGCTLLMDGVVTLRNLYDVYAAANVNTSGIFATGLMGNLYEETATDFIQIYTTLKQVIKKGGPDNMINGAKKAELMWQVTALLEDLNRKLSRLTYTILCTNFTDVWNAAIAGMIDKTHKQLADEAMERWKRALGNVSKFAEYKKDHPFPF